jgi:hypothetical protein
MSGATRSPCSARIPRDAAPQRVALDVHLDKVHLTITGKRSGGVLGSLFCSLANAKVKAARARAAHRLKAEIRRTGAIRPLRVTVPVQAVAAAGPTCSVLNLVLGRLFCSLANTRSRPSPSQVLGRTGARAPVRPDHAEIPLGAALPAR